jgi:hypothetical protein
MLKIYVVEGITLLGLFLTFLCWFRELGLFHYSSKLKNIIFSKFSKWKKFIKTNFLKFVKNYLLFSESINKNRKIKKC